MNCLKEEIYLSMWKLWQNEGDKGTFKTHVETLNLTGIILINAKSATKYKKQDYQVYSITKIQQGKHRKC